MSSPNRVVHSTEHDEEDKATPESSTTQPLGEELDIAKLILLKEQFLLLDCDGSGQLTLDEFIAAFDVVFDKNLSRAQSVRLFMQIDADSSGYIDWDEFLTYMLVMHDNKTAEMLQAFPKELIPETLPECMNFSVKNGPQMFHSCAAIERYFILNRNTFLVIESKHFQTVRTIPCHMFMDRDWFTCFSVSEECSTIIACTANRRIVFIDFLTGEKTSETKVQHPIQTIQVYLQKEKYFGSAIETLWMGDTGGGILMGTLADFRIDKKFERHAVHTDWITKVEYVPELQAVLSSSLDKTLVMFDCATSTIRKRLYSTDGHVSGILTFAWLPSLRMIVSSGVDRFFVYWNPYTAKVVHRMVGHNGPVRLFALYNRLHMLIAVSDDKILKVWDIRSYKVLQSVGDDIEASRRENIRAISIDEHKCRVLIADAISIKSMLFAQTVQNLRTTTCKTPVVACLFNWVFNTIVTVSTDCAVTVWSADNGDSVFSFTDDSAPDAVTAAKFNDSGRKLILGFKSGGFKVYNFGNGQSLQEGFHFQESCSGSLSALGTFVIHSLAHGDVPMICGVGFGAMVGTWFESNQIRDIVCPPSTLYKGQDQDVVSCLTIPGNRIASGSSSGMIFIHSIESSVLIMKWHIDDVMFGYGEGLRTEYRSEALLSQTQLQSLKPQDYTNNRNKILADKIIFINFAANQKLDRKDHSCVIMCCSNDGYLRAWCMIKGGGFIVAKVPFKMSSREEITEFIIDRTNSFLLSADGAGYVKIWDVSQLQHQVFHKVWTPPNLNLPQYCRPSFINQLFMWRAHQDAITSADFLHHSSQGLMVITGCIDFNVKLWSQNGEELGIFGLTSWNISNKSTWSSNANSSDYALRVFQNLEEEAAKLREFLAKEKEIADRAKKPGFGGWNVCGSEDGLPLRTHKAADREVAHVMKKCFSPKELTMANSRPIEILMHRRREKMVLVPPKRLPVQCLSPVIPPGRSQSSMSFFSTTSSPTPGASPTSGKVKR